MIRRLTILLLIVGCDEYFLTESEEIDALVGSWEWMQQKVTTFEHERIIDGQTYTIPESTFVNLPDTNNFRLLTFNEEKTFILSGKMNGEDYLSTGIWSKNDIQIVIYQESFGTLDNMIDYDSVVVITYDYSLLLDTLILDVSDENFKVNGRYERKNDNTSDN